MPSRSLQLCPYLYRLFRHVVFGIQSDVDITASIPILLAEAGTHVGRALLYNIMVHLNDEHFSPADLNNLRNVNASSPVYHPNDRDGHVGHVVYGYGGVNFVNVVNEHDYEVVGGNGNGGFFVYDDDDGDGNYVDYDEDIFIIVTLRQLNIVFDDNGNIVDTFIGD